MVDTGIAPPIQPADGAASRRVRRILENQALTAETELGRQLRVVLMETELEYNREANAHRDPKVLAAWSSASRLLRERGGELLSAFQRHVHAGLMTIGTGRSPRPAGAAAATPQAGELRLVDDLDLDEDGLIASSAARCESRNSLALQLMGYRYGVLAAAPAFDAEHLPLGPTALSHALRASAGALGLALEARVVLYRTFEKIALAHYPALLETLNTRLAGDGVLPHLSFIPVRVRPAANDRMHLDAPTAAADARGPDQPTTAGERPQDPRPAAATSPRIAPTEGRFAQLQSLLAMRRKLLAKLRPGEQDDRVRERLPAADVQAALARMRSTQARAADLTEVRHAVLAQARQQRGHGVVLADPDADGFELFGLFQAQLERLLRKGSPGEILVERLRLPLLQLALRDHGFFVDPRHPARRVLDAVSLAGANWLADDDLDPQLLGLLQRAVGTVLEDGQAQHDSFVAANHALQAGLQAAARKHEMSERRQVEAARGRERLGLARQQANAEIARILAGRGLPRFHGMLVEHAWADVLALAWLRSGEESTAWQELRDATEAIVEAALAPGRPAEPGFTGRLESALSLVGYHAEEAGMIARALANGRAEEEDELASRTELVVQLRARTRLGDEGGAIAAGEDSPRTASQQAAWDRLAGLAEAQWVDLRLAGRDAPVRRRLAWVSPRSGQALLLNRRGMRAEDATLDDLCRRLAAGDLALVEADTHPAELAWQSTYATLEHIAGGQEASHG